MNLQSFLSELSIYNYATLVIFSISFIIQLIYYLVFYRKLAVYRKPSIKTNNNEPVSVIISARNEDYKLRKNLPAILNQDYPNFEVIVVNHASDDDSDEVLDEFGSKYKNLKIVKIEQDLNFFKGKKFPLSIGIKSAKNDLLLLTDADCKPNSDKWITNMTSNYTSSTEVILGYGPYNYRKGFLNKIIRYDTFIIAMQYFSFALFGIPYMGVGRNLSYRKSLFMRNKGFISHYNISSGDDDLFIMEVASKKNTKIEVSKESFVYSDAKQSFVNYIKQKKRHLTTGKIYPFKFKFLLGLNSITQILFNTLFIVLLFDFHTIIPALILFLIYTLVRMIIQKKAAAKLGEDQLLLFSLFGDFIYVFLMSAISLSSLIRKQKDWK